MVTLEGTEGSGKSTQARALAAHLERAGIPVLLAREPGGTDLGEALREILLGATGPRIDRVAETLLFAAARAQLVSEAIAPALRAGKVAVCDRFGDSTIAYQAFGRGLDRTAVADVVKLATGGLVPDLTVLLDLEVDDGLGRKAPGGGDRFETLDSDFHRRVREGYLALAGENPGRWLVVDGSQPVEAVHQAIIEMVERLLRTSGAKYGSG